MKPISASEVLRRSAPREYLGLTFTHRNRYETLREPSPAPSMRSRLESNASIKRKPEDDGKLSAMQSYVNSEEDDIAVACMESRISKVSDTCKKMLEELQRLHIEEPLRILLADMVEAVTTTNQVQNDIVNRMKVRAREEQEVTRQYVESDNAKSYSKVASSSSAMPPPRQSVPSNPRKKLSGGLQQMSTGDSGKYADRSKKDNQVTETEEEKKHRKFAEAVRDAERSTLCFNLNMGNKPLMNKTTISERASLALTTMAAKVEGKNSSVPSPDTIAAIDDVTSMVTNMEFYGTNTKEYKGKDASGYCTIPVRYQFKDREQRVFAESQLRELCHVKCSTPYPAILRECIKQVVDHVRETYPQDYVRVNVMTKEFALKVSRRPPGKNLPWVTFPDLISLPTAALDVTSKKLPTGMRMGNMPGGQTPEQMDTNLGEGSSPSQSVLK
jgi:hypothetical protein